jgi:acetyl-CoA synthetase
MITPLPGAVATKPGSCTFPLPGIMADVVDEAGEPVELGKGGILVDQAAVPVTGAHACGAIPSVSRSPISRKSSTASTTWPATPPTATPTGYFWIMGRIDDVLNVSGHRLGTMEIESALVANPMVAEAAVVGRPDDHQG